MPMTTPIPHAQWMDWAPAEKGVSTVWATTPTPKMISVKVPSSSADSSQTSVFRRNEQPSLVPPWPTGSRRAPSRSPEVALLPLGGTDDGTTWNVVFGHAEQRWTITRTGGCVVKRRLRGGYGAGV